MTENSNTDGDESPNRSMGDSERVVVVKGGAPRRVFENEDEAREWALDQFGEFGSVIYPSVPYDTDSEQ